MNGSDHRPLVLLHGEITTPPLSTEARRRTGFLLRLLRQGVALSMPDSRPMPGTGHRCHELRVRDDAARVTWRVLYRLDADAVVVADVFAKKTRTTPSTVVRRAKARFARYDEDRRKVDT